MDECLLCKRKFNRLKFITDHIKICTRCVNTLNEASVPAKDAYDRLGELLAKGMRRNAMYDLESDKDWILRKARWTLDNFAAAHERALPSWLDRLLADGKNSSRDYKMARAHRRYLLRLEGNRQWSYPPIEKWKKVTSRIRKRDGYKCVACGAHNVALDVHHIIYLSNFGTNRQNNLVTLCRPCHEAEHGRVFDFGEVDDPDTANPILPNLEKHFSHRELQPAFHPKLESAEQMVRSPESIGEGTRVLPPKMTVELVTKAAEATAQLEELPSNLSDSVRTSSLHIAKVHKTARLWLLIPAVIFLIYAAVLLVVWQGQ